MEEHINVLNREKKGSWKDYTFGAREMQRALFTKTGKEVIRDGQLIVVNHYGDFYIFEAMGDVEVINDNTNIYVRPGTEAFYKLNGDMPYGKPRIVKAQICRLPSEVEVSYHSRQPTV